ncbi:copper resistance protein [Brachybacterium sp. EF45031]|uniref:copper homeostasis protein CutC n=1 Tax=Brachybacterium sillae TaxID=2810536 RepID=UPI00217F065F|nr:copper homeostasis protein CutC [Brachybacterium sillae]MCS6711345.1 copper resistance protein [Brachybacterium sillae]
MSVRVEIAVQDVAGLEAAARAGADRMELSVDLRRDGLTPPVELVERCAHRLRALRDVQEARAHASLHVLIRPEDSWGGEPALMARQAAESVAAGADGVVIGALTDGDTRLDLPLLEQVRDAALTAAAQHLRGIDLTLHRCVDALPDAAAREEAVRQALHLGAHRVLSSGGAVRALDGAADLRRMVAAGEGLVEIMAGGGVRADHLATLVRTTGVEDVHLSAGEPLDIDRIRAAVREAGEL